ncbi:MAG TPA: 3-oxoacyl-[acyl-carrier-protein] synthase III C-terminal domain-containing protein [Thermoanaerobaculaceae bacterium]|nr:3-oxoacyl-[acyl-carrier-protein] synthase III C-terminal domain-containing protein [Thermoanaerobaculaceae bacterium]HRS17781.1 3-oxoacyl-[acyl-carrier-protein] synthase III C-terminal domain-containing protein [Thermoanaerobaculaceae bacterium]
MNAGVYRDRHTCEPAMACYIQHRLGINVEFQGRRTLAFDLCNGGVGMLSAVHVVAALIAAGGAEVGLVVASDANSDRRPDPAYTYPASGAAVLLDAAPRTGAGFGAFAFETLADRADLYTSCVSLSRPRGRVVLRRRAGLEDAYLQASALAVARVLEQERMRRDEVDLVVPAQISAAFLARLPAAIAFGREKVLDLSGTVADTLSTSLFLAFHRAVRAGLLGPGKVALLVACGSGVTAGAALYRC